MAGAISSGKSTVCSLLEEKGAVVVSADRIGHALLEKGESIHEKIVERFGKGILDGEGRIDRKKLGGEVFSTPEALADLDKIIHPRLIEILRNKIGEMRRGGSGIGVVDAALISEWGLQDEFDVYVYVHAPRERRATWYIEKTGRTREDFELRDRAQWPPEKKGAGADIRLENDQGEKELLDKAEHLSAILQEMEQSQEQCITRVKL